MNDSHPIGPFIRKFLTEYVIRPQFISSAPESTSTPSARGWATCCWRQQTVTQKSTWR
jgi:hypothetical protein